MRKIAAAVVFSILTSSVVFAGQISADHPDGILCRMPATQDRADGVSVFYLSAILSDGRVLYQTMGNQVLLITFDTSGSPVMDSGNICEGMSLSDLEAAGMTFGF